MINRRQLLTWWRRPEPSRSETVRPRRDVAPPLAYPVPPTPIDTEPFSLEAFYAARKPGGGR